MNPAPEGSQFVRNTSQQKYQIQPRIDRKG